MMSQRARRGGKRGADIISKILVSRSCDYDAGVAGWRYKAVSMVGHAHSASRYGIDYIYIPLSSQRCPTPSTYTSSSPVATLAYVIPPVRRRRIGTSYSRL